MSGQSWLLADKNSNLVNARSVQAIIANNCRDLRNQVNSLCEPQEIANVLSKFVRRKFRFHRLPRLAM